MLVYPELLAAAHPVLPDRVLIVGPRTRVGAMWRHHILLVGAVVDVDRSLLHS